MINELKRPITVESYSSLFLCSSSNYNDEANIG